MKPNNIFFQWLRCEENVGRVKFSDRSAEVDLTRLQKFNLTEEEDSEGICRFDRSYSGPSNININIIIIMKIVGKFANFWHILINGRPYYSTLLNKVFVWRWNCQKFKEFTWVPVKKKWVLRPFHLWFTVIGSYEKYLQSGCKSESWILGVLAKYMVLLKDTIVQISHLIQFSGTWNNDRLSTRDSDIIQAIYWFEHHTIR